MKNAFYFMQKLSAPEKFTCLSLLFGYVEKRLDKISRHNYPSLSYVLSATVDVTDWTTNNYNARIAQYLSNSRQPDNELCSVNRV